MTYREAKLRIAQQLKEAGIENELAESAFLMEAACRADHNFYLLHQMDEITEGHKNAYFNLADLRCRHIPLQYLTGEQEFMGIPFKVNEHVLIPRQDTEVLVEEALEILKVIDQDRNLCGTCGGQISDRRENNFTDGRQEKTAGNRQEDAQEQRKDIRVLDICTGSGCIAVSLKAFCPEIKVSGSDISAEALAVARENAARNHLDVEFTESDLFSHISGMYDMIVSNPPYIPSDVIPTLMPEVRDHEPMNALDGMSDGLHFYRKIIAECSDYLLPGGYLLFEIGYDQGEAVAELMEKHKFTDIEVIPDLAGLDRVVKGRRQKNV